MRDRRECEHDDLREASDPDTPSERLSKLSNSKSEIVRGAVAANPSTLNFDIEILSKDESAHVQESLELRDINIKLHQKPPPKPSKSWH